MADPNNILPPINQSDMTDPTVFRINVVLQLLASQLAETQVAVKNVIVSSQVRSPSPATDNFVTINGEAVYY